MKRIEERLVADEATLKPVEYVVIAGLVVVATVVVLGSIGVWIFSTLQTVVGALGA